MTISACPLFRPLSGVKRTSIVAAHMSANDPKRTWGLLGLSTQLPLNVKLFTSSSQDECEDACRDDARQCERQDDIDDRLQAAAVD
jgi:hypothetical protein